MLYNPKWEAEPTAKPMTLPHFIAWLEKFPAGQQYTYYDSRICLASQYCAACSSTYWIPNLFSGGFRRQIENIAFAKPHTFGAACARAKLANTLSRRILLALI